MLFISTMTCRIFLFRIFLFLFICVQSESESTLTKSCTGHDGCKNDEWVGSYDITCNGGERICHNTVLKCGRESCSIKVKGGGHDAYQKSIVYAQNIKKGGKFKLSCKSTGSRECRDNIIYCPREVGTECECENCHSSTIMYYKYGTRYISGGATIKRYWDEPVVCDGKIVCDVDKRTNDLDYGSYAYWQYIYHYTSVSNSYTLYTDINGNTLQDFSMFIAEDYKSWSYKSLAGQNPSYTYELINYTQIYGTMGKICRRRSYDDPTKYYAYRGYCDKYKYGDPYEGFWILGEPAQSCTDACINYNMTCDKQQHLNHLPELENGPDFGGILHRFNATCDSYTIEYQYGKRTPVYNALTRECVLSNASRTGNNWYCNEPPWTNGVADEDKRRLCWCAPTTTKPQKICDVNRTRWINTTRYINTTRWIDKEMIKWVDIRRYINITRWNDKIRWKNNTHWINKTNIINKTIISYKIRYIDKIRWKNETMIVSNKYIYSQNHTEIDKETQNSIIFGLTNQDIIILSGSMGGIAFLFCMFYITWEYCGLKDKVSSCLQDIILDYCCFGIGEYFLCILDIIGCINTTRGNEEDDESSNKNTTRIARQATQEIVDEVHKKMDSIGIEITEPKHYVIHHREIFTSDGTRETRKRMSV